mmetsp:Transcript_32261/g.77286  ORF Transcript_32261/g.77286 Transcript_32261/m.77286 type:complete len:360 (-) Transcript_32261:563-1642(-)
MDVLQSDRFLLVQRALSRNDIDVAKVVLFPLRSIQLCDLQGIVSEYNVSGKDFLHTERYGIVRAPECRAHRCSLFTVQMLSQWQHCRAFCSLLHKIVRQHLLHLRNSPPSTNHFHSVQIIHSQIRTSQSLVNRSQNLRKHVLHPPLEVTPFNVCSKILLFKQAFNPKATLFVCRQDVLGFLGRGQQFLQSTLVLADAAQLGIFLLESSLHLLRDNNIGEVAPGLVRITASQGLQHWGRLGQNFNEIVPNDACFDMTTAHVEEKHVSFPPRTNDVLFQLWFVLFALFRLLLLVIFVLCLLIIAFLARFSLLLSFRHLWSFSFLNVKRPLNRGGGCFVDQMNFIEAGNVRSINDGLPLPLC